MRGMQDLAALLRLGAGLVAIVHGGGQLPAQVVGHALAVAPDLGGLGCDPASTASARVTRSMCSCRR
ncbi:hypothetical protein [Streptosporangium sandarakinum]